MITRRRRLTRSLVLLLVLLLIATAINMPLAIRAMPGARPVRAGTSISLYGLDAGAKGWPEHPPAPWPAVTQWSEERQFGSRTHTAWSQDESAETTHQMEVDYYGWPLPCLKRVRAWWPEGNPAPSPRLRPGTTQDGASGRGAGPGIGEFSDSALTIDLRGIVVNPFLLALPPWLLIVAPPLLVGAWIRQRRRRKGHCLNCGYDRRDAIACPECGQRTDSRD